MVQPFQSHARRHGAITHHTHHFVLLMPLVTRFYHPECGGDAGAGMTGVKRVVASLFAFTKSASPPILPERVKLLPAAG